MSRHEGRCSYCDSRYCIGDPCKEKEAYYQGTAKSSGRVGGGPYHIPHSLTSPFPHLSEKSQESLTPDQEGKSQGEENALLYSNETALCDLIREAPHPDDLVVSGPDLDPYHFAARYREWYESVRALANALTDGIGDDEEER